MSFILGVGMVIVVTAFGVIPGLQPKSDTFDEWEKDASWKK